MEQKVFCVKTYYETKSFKIVQTKYWRKFNPNTFPNTSQIFKSVKNFEPHGTCEDRRATCSSRSRPPITQDEGANVIKNFAHLTQQNLQHVY